MVWLAGCGGDGTNSADSTGPSVLNAGARAPDSGGGTVYIYASVGDPSGVTSVVAAVTKPDGSVVTLRLKAQGSIYAATFEADPNTTDKPAVYSVVMVATDGVKNATSTKFTFQVSGLPAWITLASGLKYRDTVVGSGAEAKSGDNLSVNYRGTLDDGTVFDQSSSPFTFNLGAGEVIKGWDQGVVGMKVGGTRQLVIPPDLGYGDRPAGSIPPNSTLHFDVQLTAIN